MEQSGDDPVRVDVWLWAARLAKTRPLAVALVRGGHVEVNGQRVKPSRELHPGDRVALVRGSLRIAVDVRATARRRVSASAAALLYEETPESREAREREAAERRLAGPADPRAGARPTKRDRRRLEQARGTRRRG
jgi:ribosome-associated heat shock protein Hsp15